MRATRRRPITISPIPDQATAPTAPPYIPAAVRGRRVGRWLRRPAEATPVPAQQAAPTAPSIVLGAPRARRIAALVRRPRTAVTNLAVIPDQAVAPRAPVVRRRPVPPIDRRRGAVPVPSQTGVPAPGPAPRPVRRRILSFLRRGPARKAFPVQPGNPDITIPRPGTVEPGQRFGPGASPGTRRGAHNEPGTRSGPTISGGQ